MSVEWSKELLFQQLDLSGLDKWSDRNTQTLLAKYPNIFSLEPGESGCMDLVVDDEPFKESFQRISPLMVDEVGTHMREMLEVGTICSSQSPWYNVVVLVCKKEVCPFALTFRS